jgi:hypothetical protein
MTIRDSCRATADEWYELPGAESLSAEANHGRCRSGRYTDLPT